MRAFLHLTATVFRLYTRDLLTVVLSLALIVFMMVLFGLVMGEEQFQIELPVAVVDGAGNPAAQRFLELIEQDDLLKLQRVASEAEIDEQIRRAEVIAGVVLSPDFAELAPSGEPLPGLHVITSERADRWTRFGLDRLQRLAEALSTADHPPAWRTTAKPIDVIKSRYIDFIFPGILAMAIMQACLASGVVLLQAKSIGVLRRLRLTPVGPLSLFGGFVAGRLAVVLLHLLVLIAVAVLAFGTNLPAAWGDLALAVLLGSATFMSLGVMLALIAPSFEAGNLLIQMVSLPMSFLCGVFFKLEAIPAALAWLPKILPLTYLVDILRGVIHLGLPLASFRTELAILAGWLGVALAVCAVAYRFWDRDA